MPNAVDLLSEVTSSPDWVPEWMTIAEIAAELDRRGLLNQQPFRRVKHSARLEFLAGILVGHSTERGPIWVRLGSRFKHVALLTDDDQTLVERWIEDRRAALDEDLSRILLGEPSRWRVDAPAKGRLVNDTDLAPVAASRA